MPDMARSFPKIKPKMGDKSYITLCKTFLSNLFGFKCNKRKKNGYEGGKALCSVLQTDVKPLVFYFLVFFNEKSVRSLVKRRYRFMVFPFFNRTKL